MFVRPLGRVYYCSDGRGVVEFSTADLALITQLAATRSNGSRSNGLFDARRTRALSSEEIDRIGLAGEMAAGRVLGLPVRVSDRPEAGVDFVLPDGRTVDVKATISQPPRLTFHKPCRADIGLLVQVDKDLSRAWVVGWMESPPVGSTSAEKLRPIQSLRAGGPRT
jgi:hypothetical protein